MEVLETVDRKRVAALRERDEFFWLDLTSPSPADVETVGEVLGLHPVALEDTTEFGQRPKLDLYGDHLLFVFYTVRRSSGEAPVEPVEIHVYISGSFVVTVRRSACTELDELHDELDTADPKAEHYIVYRIFDVLTDAFYPIIELLEEQIDALEGQVLLAKPRHEQLVEIY
ncbi:MAG: magnesium transporter CorA, partial [Actinomycetota bacterium]|nr:magnesium transporter CorA [Actinomycetota bacterium]